MNPDPFFEYARARQTILIRRRAGLPRPWTNDPILDHYKFCNVFREDDRTTIWFRENVRDRLKDKQEVLLATILFRWFNRMTTGEAIFSQIQNYLLEGKMKNQTAWEKYLEDGYTNWLKIAIKDHCGKGPYVTGAYCIIGMPHMPKLDGILACVDNVYRCTSGVDFIPGIVAANWRTVANYLLSHPAEVRAEQVWEWFRRFPRSGDFMAYEVVTDLSYTKLLDQAPDLMTWANAGPGAIRGLNRLYGRPLNQSHPKQKTNEEMQGLLRLANRDWNDWPQWSPRDEQYRFARELPLLASEKGSWPAWDMRTVEHTLCEFDKYERLHLGEGKVKGVYR